MWIWGDRAVRAKPITRLLAFALAFTRRTSVRLYDVVCTSFDKRHYAECDPLHVVHKRPFVHQNTPRRCLWGSNVRKSVAKQGAMATGFCNRWTYGLGYAWVSKGEVQDTRLQETALRAAGGERLRTKHTSGGRWDRPGLH